jgi:hypothetical protein
MKSIPSFARSPDSTPTDKTAEVIDGLDTLRRGLSRARGFALFVVVCKKPSGVDTIIGMLGEILVGKTLHTVRLDSQTSDPLDDLISQVPKPTGPVVLTGLDQAVPLGQRVHPVLRNLNIRRPQWPEKVGQPVVLSVPESVWPMAAREAPDFLDWRSDTVLLPDLSACELDALREHIRRAVVRDSQFAEKGHDRRLSLEQAREHALSVLRQAEEERRLLAMREAEVELDMEQETGL